MKVCEKEISCALFALISPQFCWALFQQTRNSLNWISAKQGVSLEMGCFLQEHFGCDPERLQGTCWAPPLRSCWEGLLCTSPVSQCSVSDWRQDKTGGAGDGWSSPQRGFIVKGVYCKITTASQLSSFLPSLGPNEHLFIPWWCWIPQGSLSPSLTALPVLVPRRCSWSGSGRQIPWRESVQSSTTQN